MNNQDIYYIHQGKPPTYLLRSMANTRAFNNNCRIFLLTEKHHLIPKYLNIITRTFDELETSKHQTFLNEYKHLSKNSFSFERFCFSRWFYLEAASRYNKSDIFAHLDSDCLIFDDMCNLETLMLPSNTQYCYGINGAPHLALFRNDISDLTTYMINSFKSDLYKNWQKSNFVDSNKNFCDMAVMIEFAKKVGSLHRGYLTDGNYVVEENMGIKEGYQIWSGPKHFKRVHWRIENSLLIPYLLTASQIYKRALALHYKGSAKKRICSFNYPNQSKNICAVKKWFHNRVPPINRWPIIKSKLGLG